jgi:3-oxoacyl-[acyl-carrier protein] reductase
VSDIALVTGSSRGIGRAIAVRLAKGGYRVAINFASNADAAKETLAMVEDVGSEGIVVQADVSDPSQVDEMFDEIDERLGAVVALVNNAGTRRDGLMLSMSDEDFNAVIQTNLFGVFACCRRALRPMIRARKGHIVNISSIAGTHGNPGQANYSAAKAGVIGLTRTLAREVGSKGITVNAVAPGYIDTDLTADIDENRRGVLFKEIPLRRSGTTEEIAGAVAWLCSPESSYVTGAVISVDGGITA